MLIISAAYQRRLIKSVNFSKTCSLIPILGGKDRIRLDPHCKPHSSSRNKKGEKNIVSQNLLAKVRLSVDNAILTKNYFSNKS
jgi:hypothetical protein